MECRIGCGRAKCGTRLASFHSQTRSSHMRTLLPLTTALALFGCAPSEDAGAPAPTAGGDLGAIMAARGLSDADIVNAAKTYTPSGKHDEYVIFASGGHGGNMIVIGVPSMRILKYIAVFGP